MTSFEQSIFNYFISASALAGFAVLWRNWLNDHQQWKGFLEKYLGRFSKMLTCGSCFTFWITLAYVLILNPLNISFAPHFVGYFIEWLSLGWTAVFLRFSYIAVQEKVSMMVHRPHGHT
jgi:hypothetical protein